MRTEPRQEGDQRLHELLQTWKVSKSPPPGFPDRVWRRIESEEARPVSLWSRLEGDILARLRAFLVQPAGAAAYLLALLVVGSGLGYWRSESYTAQAERAWRVAYVQSVNPTAISMER
jgi:hypothetical protein